VAVAAGRGVGVVEAGLGRGAVVVFFRFRRAADVRVAVLRRVVAARERDFGRRPDAWRVAGRRLADRIVFFLLFLRCFLAVARAAVLRFRVLARVVEALRRLAAAARAVDARREEVRRADAARRRRGERGARLVAAIQSASTRLISTP
jgi:hypothetical protein